MSHADYLKAFDQYIEHCEATGYVWHSFECWKSMYNGRYLGVTH